MPTGDRPDEHDDVAHVVSEYNRLLGANDVEAALAFCSEDMRLMPPTGPVIEGKSALRTFIGGWPTYKKSDAYGFRVEIREDLAVAACAASVVHLDPDGNERSLAAKQLATLGRHDGEWKITALIFNSEPQPDVAT